MGAYNIRVNAIAPGRFPDKDQLSEDAYQQRQEQARDTVLLGRLGELKEVGYLAIYLASPAGDYVTGQTWAIDGGISIMSP